MKHTRFQFKLAVALVIQGFSTVGSVTLACDSSEVACNQVLQQQQRDAWIYYQGGGDIGNGTLDSGNSTYIPPTVITLPDSWGAIAVGSSSAGIASKQASKQASNWLYSAVPLEDQRIAKYLKFIKILALWRQMVLTHEVMRFSRI